jgi:hypothetical protein
MSDLYIKVIETDSEFDRVKNEWLNFEKKVNNQNINASYIWQRTWWKHFKGYEPFGYNKKLCILFLYNKENILRAIAPFCEVTRKHRGIRYKTIEFIAQQWGATYLDIISDGLSKEEFNFIFDWLKKNRIYDVIELKYIPEFTPNFYLKKNNITVLSGCPEIEIKDFKDVDQYRQKTYSKSLRKNLRTAKNRIKRENVNYCEEISDIINDIDFKEIERVSQSKLIDNKSCIYNNFVKKEFLKDIYYDFDLPTNVVKIILNNKLGSYRINFLYNKSKYCSDASYGRNYRHYDLGALSIDLNIRDSFERKILIHCMGPGIDSYKLKFSKRIVRIYTLLEKGNSLKGKILYVIKKRLNQKIADTFLEELKIKQSYKGIKKYGDN